MSLTFFPQETRVSCTVACLRMVLSHFGIVADEPTLSECCGTTTQGTRAPDAIRCAPQYGLQAEEWRDVRWTDVRQWLSAGTYPIALINLFPLKAIWALHAVVIASLGDETISYLDPLYGHQTAARVAFNQAWEMNLRRAIVIQQTK